MTNFSRRNALKAIGVGTLATIGGTGVVAGRGPGGRGGDEAKLRVAHASPDAPAVDVFVNDATVIDGLEFREVTGYLEVPTGDYTIEVAVTDGGPTVFGPVTVPLAAEDYTAVALGEAFSDDTEFTVSLFEDTNGANIGNDESRIRAIHASPDAPAVDVTVNDNALTVFDDVAFGESSGYAVVPAGTYEVEIRPGTGGDPVFEAEVTFEGRSTYTAFAMGYLTPDDEDADEPFGLVPTLDAGAPPRGRGRGRGRGPSGTGRPF
ncbi:MAG TPA: DUF4397 domain-containing protein [Natrialbaceae archaeon]|nr:DUF4397 domain-containing protein [Natrialbaceae archaeon]